jgi:hypothetical protein
MIAASTGCRTRRKVTGPPLVTISDKRAHAEVGTTFRVAADLDHRQPLPVIKIGKSIQVDLEMWWFQCPIMIVP